jgi:prepilin-type N-terminal cleavage/methylation domain-containing protein
MSWFVRRRLTGADGQAGFTLIELLVASTMGVVVMGGVLILLLGSLQTQPQLDKKAANIQAARWVLERMTHELRNGIGVAPGKATASSLSFEAYVRQSSCGAATMLPSGSPPIKCEITYSCSGEACTRIEANPGVYTGTATTILSGLSNTASVFTYSPSSTSPTFVGVTLKIPDPSGSGSLTASDGASLRNATLGD